MSVTCWVERTRGSHECQTRPAFAICCRTMAWRHLLEGSTVAAAISYTSPPVGLAALRPSKTPQRRRVTYNTDLTRPLRETQEPQLYVICFVRNLVPAYAVPLPQNQLLLSRRVCIREREIEREGEMGVRREGGIHAGRYWWRRRRRAATAEAATTESACSPAGRADGASVNPVRRVDAWGEEGRAYTRGALLAGDGGGAARWQRAPA